MTNPPDVEVVIWGPTRADRVLSRIRAEVRAAVGRWAQAHCPAAAAFLAEAGDMASALVFSHGYSRQPAPLATFTSSPVAALNLLDQAPSGVVVALVETGQLEGLLARWSAVIEQIPALAELLRDYADKDALRAL